ncbi:MAG: SRPBCC family protein [Pseudomonadota bacterium]
MDTETLSFTRTIAASPERVFTLFTDSDARQSWNSPGEGYTVTVTHPAKTAPGVRESALVQAADEPDTVVHTDWTTVTPEVVAHAETLEVDGEPLASSFATATIEPDGDGTKLTLLVALVSFAGAEMLEGYRMGWEAGIAALFEAT